VLVYRTMALAKNAGYTKPELRDRIKSRVMASGDGGKPGQWSARKAQLVAQKYESAGGGYSGAKTEGQKSLSKWTDQKWTTSDGKPAERKGGTTRYLPEKAWDKLSPSERSATNAKKREGSREGEQFVKNTEAAAEARKEATDKTALSRRTADRIFAMAPEDRQAALKTVYQSAGHVSSGHASSAEGFRKAIRKLNRAAASSEPQFAFGSPEWKQVMRDIRDGNLVSLESGLAASHVPSILQHGPASLLSDSSRGLWAAPAGHSRTPEYAQAAARAAGSTPSVLSFKIPASLLSSAIDSSPDAKNEQELVRGVFQRFARDVKASPLDMAAPVKPPALVAAAAPVATAAPTRHNLLKGLAATSALLGTAYGIKKLHDHFSSQNPDEARKESAMKKEAFGFATDIGMLGLPSAAGYVFGRSQPMTDALAKKEVERSYNILGGLVIPGYTGYHFGTRAAAGEHLRALEDKARAAEMAAQKEASDSGAWQRSEGKNPEGGLNAKGRASLKAQGHDIKPGVKGPADTPEKMKRKGSFLSRMFGPGAPGAMKKDNGEPSRRALSAKAWGEPVPSDDAGRARLYAKGQAMLKRYSGKEKEAAWDFPKLSNGPGFAMDALREAMEARQGAPVSNQGLMDALHSAAEAKARAHTPLPQIFAPKPRPFWGESPAQFAGSVALPIAAYGLHRAYKYFNPDRPAVKTAAFNAVLQVYGLEKDAFSFSDTWRGLRDKVKTLAHYGLLR